MKHTLSQWALFLYIVSFCHSMDRHRNKVCYKAMTCIHTGREKCGSDSSKGQRRFYDSCDLLEYNCLKGTNYVKASEEKCKKLPPLDDGKSQKDNQNQDDHENENEGNTDDNDVDDGEGGIKGTITVDDDGSVEAEIEIDDDVLEEALEGENEDNDGNNEDGESGIQGEVDINDEDGSIDAKIDIDDEPDDQGNGDDYIEGEVVADDDEENIIDGNKGVEGEIVIDDEGNVEGSIRLVTAEEDGDGPHPGGIEAGIETKDTDADLDGAVKDIDGQLEDGLDEEDGPHPGGIAAAIETKDTDADIDQAVKDVEGQFDGVEGKMESVAVDYN